MRFLVMSLVLNVSFFSASAILRAEVNATREYNTATAEVSVDFTTTKTISPFLFGHNIEYIGLSWGICDPKTGIVRPDLLPYLRDLKAGIMRFPGGTLSNYYHWADGIGPRAKRGAGCPDWEPKHAPCIDMSLGTDEFFQFTKAIGCPAAVFTVNIPTAKEIKDKPWMGTAPEAAAWVAYCNATPENKTVLGTDAHGKDWGVAGDWAKKRVQNGHREPYGVKFWELGNEIFTSIKDPADYAKTCHEFSKAMKAVDPSIHIGVIMNDFHFALKDSPWNRTVLKETKGVSDFLVAHFYLPGIRGGGDGNLTAKDTTRITLVSPDRFRNKLADLRWEIAQAGLRPDFGIAITEFSCNLRMEGETDKRRLALIRSQQAAVYLADTLLAYHEAGVTMSNYWALRSWEWSVLETVEEKNIPQAPYFVYKLLADTWQDSFCPATVRCGKIELNLERKVEFKAVSHPSLVAGASINATQTQTAVLLVNRALERDTNVTVHLTGGSFPAEKGIFTILAAKPSAVNTPQTPNALKLTSRSVQVLGPQAVKVVMPPCSIGVLYWKNEKGSKP
jgi:alpha-L-arabinofuranosidase